MAREIVEAMAQTNLGAERIYIVAGAIRCLFIL
jgi:hypothetical protein